MGARALRRPSNSRMPRAPRGRQARGPGVANLLSQLVGFARQLPIQERAFNGGALDLNLSVTSSKWSSIIWSDPVGSHIRSIYQLVQIGVLY